MSTGFDQCTRTTRNRRPAGRDDIVGGTEQTASRWEVQVAARSGREIDLTQWPLQVRQNTLLFLRHLIGIMANETCGTIHDVCPNTVLLFSNSLFRLF